MRRAIDIARPQVGRTAENPAVGCVIVKDGQIIGEGVTGDGGRPHAEEVALHAAGDAAEGADVYVTLEPCAHRTSGAHSCSTLLAHARVKSVTMACDDSSTHASAQGIEVLKVGGIKVTTGFLRVEAAPLYAGYTPRKD